MVHRSSRYAVKRHRAALEDRKPEPSRDFIPPFRKLQLSYFACKPRTIKILESRVGYIVQRVCFGKTPDNV
jgi:hypothetical protein